MGSRGLKVEPTNRKRLLLAVLALLILITVTLPLIAEAAPASPTPNIQPSATASPTEPATTPSPTPLASEITIQKESNSKWWIVYPDGKKVAFESVADYRFAEPTTDEESSAFWIFEVVDNNGNKLPVEFKESVQYMRSKGLWETADRDKAEKDWWDKITRSFDDILEKLKGEFEAIQAIGIFLSNGDVVGALITGVLHAAGDFAGNITTTIFEYTDQTELLFNSYVGQIFVGLAASIGFIFWVIGFFISTSEVAINLRGNRSAGDALQDYGRNTFKSFLAVTLFTLVPLPLYLFVSKLALNICNKIGIWGAGNMIKPDFSSIFGSIANKMFPGTADTFVLLFLIVFLFCGLKVLFATVKRGGILMILTLVGSIHMLNTPRGYWDAFWSWCRQVIALCITQFCQMLLFCGGMAVFSKSLQTSNLAVFFAGIGMFLAAAEVPKIADRYGLDSSLKGNAMGAVQTIAMVARKIITKGA